MLRIGAIFWSLISSFGQHDGVSWELARVGVDVDHALMLTFARLEHAVAQAQVHPVVFELLGQRQGHVQVDRREQVLSALDGRGI